MQFASVVSWSPVTFRGGCLFISGRFRGSGCLGAAFFIAPRSLPCLQVLLSLVTNRVVETRVLLSLVPGTFGQSEGTVADDS